MFQGNSPSAPNDIALDGGRSIGGWRGESKTNQSLELVDAAAAAGSAGEKGGKFERNLDQPTFLGEEGTKSNCTIEL